MNVLDFVLLGLMLWGAVSGFRKGFLFMLFALLALVAGVLAGWLFMGELETMLRPHFKLNEKYLPYLSFLLLFATTLLVVRTVGALTKWALHKTILGWADRLAGAFLGALKTMCWLGIVIILVNKLVTALPWWMEQSFICTMLNKCISVLPLG